MGVPFAHFWLGIKTKDFSRFLKQLSHFRGRGKFPEWVKQHWRIERLVALRWVNSILLLVVLFASYPAQASYYELGGSFSFNRTNYGSSGYSWSRRWGVSLGYYFFGLSEVEFSFQDVLYRNLFGYAEDSTYHDQIYSVDWVQAITPKEWGFQPYFKLGAGELHRTASATYWGATAGATYEQLTAILGAGIKIFLTRSASFRVEGTTYLTDGSISSWQNNFAINAGCSIYF